ncbi:MAG: hypothetical protein PHC61_11045 [Chitinivibrionales bacterium]|nr:hypothetical protein [Chitinivibrionales bacterium]
MWFIFFIAAMVVTIVIIVFCMIELNALEKDTENFVTDAKKHYGIE